jgi:uncharacterized membrane protein YidH (DUF202 family)
MKNFKKIALLIFILTTLFLPSFSFAATTTTLAQACTTSGIEKVICNISFLLNKIIPLLITLGVIYFVWGVVQYVIKDDEEAKKAGTQRMIYGIIGLVVIFSMWGLVTIVTDSLGISTTNTAITNSSSFVPLPADSGFCKTGGLGNRPVVGDVINYVTCLIAKSVVPLIFTLAVVSFIWGVVQYVINNEEEAKKEKAKSFMIWGIIALTVMVSIWGIVSIVGGTFGIDTSVIPQVNQ